MKDRNVSITVPNTVVQKLEKLLHGREQQRKREEKKDQVTNKFTQGPLACLVCSPFACG